MQILRLCKSCLLNSYSVPEFFWMQCIDSKLFQVKHHIHQNHIHIHIHILISFIFVPACLVTILYFPEASNCFHIFLIEEKKKCVLFSKYLISQLYTFNFLSPVLKPIFPSLFHCSCSNKWKICCSSFHAKYFTVNLNASLFHTHPIQPNLLSASHCYITSQI